MPGADAGGDRAVIAGGENVGEQRQVFDLGHRLVGVGEFQQVEVGVGNHDILGLSADPAAHVDVAVRRAGPGGIHVQADAGFSFLAVAAAAAGDVERHGDDVALLDEQHVAAGFDHFAGDFVPEDQPGRRGGAAADHVLIGAADIGGDDFENDAVLNFFLAGRIVKLGKIDRF